MQRENEVCNALYYCSHRRRPTLCILVNVCTALALAPCSSSFAATVVHSFTSSSKCAADKRATAERKRGNRGEIKVNACSKNVDQSGSICRSTLTVPVDRLQRGTAALMTALVMGFNWQSRLFK